MQNKRLITHASQYLSRHTEQKPFATHYNLAELPPQKMPKINCSIFSRKGIWRSNFLIHVAIANCRAMEISCSKKPPARSPLCGRQRFIKSHRLENLNILLAEFFVLSWFNIGVHLFFHLGVYHRFGTVHGVPAWDPNICLITIMSRRETTSTLVTRPCIEKHTSGNTCKKSCTENKNVLLGDFVAYCQIYSVITGKRLFS